MRQVLCAVLTAIVLPALPASALEVKLTVEERLGVARAAEPVTSGVPLPAGAVKETAGLRLFDSAGKAVPAQFGVANRWWKDGSIKWLHVDFQSSVGPKAKAEYVLKDGAGSGAAPVPPGELKVSPAGDGFAVSTGPLAFTVKGKGFNLFDEVKLGGKQLVAAGHKGGFVLKTPAGEFSPAASADGKVVIEEQGPMKVVLLATGRNVAADGSGYALDYKCRIYAYAGSPLVRVVYTVENRRGKWAEHVDLSDWKLTLPLATGAGANCLFGLADGKPVAAPAAGEPRLDVLATDLYRLAGTGAAELQGDPKKEGPPWIGALDVRGAEGGAVVAVRNFWQNWAKYLGAGKDGSLTVGFWTDRVRDKGETTMVDAAGCAQFFAGVAWTHEFAIRFHDGRLAEPLAAVAVAREPLFARCPPAWYCWGTKVFGDLSEADPEVYLPAWRDKVAGLNNWAEKAVKRPLERWRSDRAGKVDSFGMFNYGDGVEEITGNRPEDVHWEGGYYDYPHSVILNFARTADPFYLWLAQDMSRHNADVHHTHHDEHPGRSRYCPSFAHILMDDKGRPPYASDTFNHWKNQSAIERWYLTGDHRGREAGLEIAKWALKLGNGGISFGQPRSICHGILGLWSAYDATGDRKYLDALAKFAKAVAASIDKGSKMGSGDWQRGMAIQGLCWYVEQTGDESVVPAIEKALERDFESGAGELAYGFVFMWKRTGDAKYFKKAAAYIKDRKAEQWMQRFGNEGRSRLYAPAIVRKDAPRPPPAE